MYLDEVKIVYVSQLLGQITNMPLFAVRSDGSLLDQSIFYTTAFATVTSLQASIVVTRSNSSMSRLKSAFASFAAACSPTLHFASAISCAAFSSPVEPSSLHMHSPGVR